MLARSHVHRNVVLSEAAVHFLFPPIYSFGRFLYVDFPTDRNRHRRRGRGRARLPLCVPSGRGKKNERIVTGAHFLCFPALNTPTPSETLAASEFEAPWCGSLVVPNPSPFI